METNNKPEEKYKSYKDFENIKVSPPSKENIDRLIKQSQGDPSFFLLCMYSFIESYIRQIFPDYNFKEKQNKEDKVYFGMLINAIKQYHFYNHPEGDKIYKQVCRDFNEQYGYRSFNDEEKKKLKEEVKKRKKEFLNPYYNTLKVIESNKKLSDKVRHNFETIPPESVDIIIENFKSFAQFEEFITQEINNIPSRADWGSGTISEESMQLISKLQKEINDMQEKYNNELAKVARDQEILKNELENKDLDIYNLQNRVKKQTKKIDEFRVEIYEKDERIKELEKQGSLDTEQQHELQSLKQEVRTLKANQDELMDKTKETENQLIEKQAELDKLNQSYENLFLMSQELAKEKEEIEKKLKESIDESNKLQSQINELARTPILSPEQEADLKKQQERYDNLKKVVENLRNQRDEIQKEHEEQVEALKKDVETYLENTTILQAYTSAVRNYHTRILKPSPEQEEIVDAIFKELSKLNNADSPEDFLLTGGPGTGKTFVLIKLLEKIATEKLNKNVKLLTYSASLNKYNQYLSQEYEEKNPQKNEFITKFMKDNIQTFDSYFIPKMEAILGKSIYTLDLRNEQDTRSEEYRTIYQIFNKLNNHDTEQIMKEAFDEIWTFVPTEKEYISKSYLGTGITLSDEQKENRQLVWNTVEKAMLEIEKLQSIPATFAYYKISSEPKYRHLSDEDKIDYLLIDEIQDLSPARIETISKLNKHSCVMAGDLNQSVFIKRKLSWIALLNKLNKTKIKPEIYTLQKNYRSTINIQNLANQYREICDIKDDSAISKSFIPGQDPELSISKNLEDALDKIRTQVQCYINVLNFNPEDICIVVPSDEELTQITGLLHDHQLKAMAMDNSAFDFAQKNVIRLSTTKQVKGVDSPIIILLLTANFVDTNKNGNTDPMSQMNSIYSCITRTMDLLYVQITEDALTSKLDNKKENSVTKLLKVWKE